MSEVPPVPLHRRTLLAAYRLPSVHGAIPFGRRQLNARPWAMHLQKQPPPFVSHCLTAKS